MPTTPIDDLSGHDTPRIVLRPAIPPAASHSLAATVDVGAAGRLLGIEVLVARDPALAHPWLDLAPTPGTPSYGPTGAHHRSVPATITALADADGGPIALDLPRHGPGYAIAYPSANR